MSAETEKLGRASAAFGAASAITALFNTALACTKDAYAPLLHFMNSVAGHNWTTQSFADLVLFIGLGLVLMKTRWAERIAPNHLIAFLVAAVAAAGLGLFTWYALF